jgi:hypothetical protein
MAKIKDIYQRFPLIYILLLLVAVVVITYFSPHGGKFKYEYQKGRPWLHEVLIAPFDFPIYKDKNDLKNEKDSILRNFSPYFNYNPKYLLSEKLKFRNFYDLYWKRQIMKSPDILKEDDKEIVLKKTLELLDFVYEKGIIELPEEFITLSNQNASIVQVRDNVAEETDLDDVFTPRKAYSYITHELNQYSDELSTQNGQNTESFFKGLNIENFIVANLYYDETTSNTIKESRLKNISLTEGMIQAGERIILTGDIVTPKIYKILESLRYEYEIRMGNSTSIIFLLFGQGLLILIVLMILLVFMAKFRKEIFSNKVKTSFIIFLTSLFAVIGSITIRYNPNILYIISFSAVAIIIKTFFDSKMALLTYIITILLVGMWAPNGFEFVFLSLLAGIVAILSLTNMYRRGKLFLSAGWIIASYVSVYLGIVLYQQGNFHNIETQSILLFVGNGLFALLAIPLIYVFEKIFGFLSDATLLELSDTNQYLLRKLAELAPGTFQHSLQVANLSEDGIFHIGGNPLLVRAGSLYHDIGKIENPMYFVENLNENVNPHENLDLEKSVSLITNHIAKGIEIAKKYKLPEEIINFIRTHHGTSTVHYFYWSYIKKYPETAIDINKFSYPGPKPFSREMAVVMMADAVEAASRSLKAHNEKDINDLVETIINGQLNEGQFNEANITLKEIEITKTVFKKRLKNIYHIRIEYPVTNYK